MPRVYDSFESLPEEIQRRINLLIEPPDPDAWVNTPIEALGGRSFLTVINGEGGDKAVAQYFDHIDAFERPDQPSGPEDLGDLLHFDATDLDANRAGLLSGRQRQNLWRRDMLIILGAAGCLVGGAIFNIALLAHWMTAHGRGAGLGVGLMFIGVLLAVWSAETWMDLATGNVLVAEGELHRAERIEAGRYGSRTIYSIEIGGQTLDVSKAVHDEIREGRRRVYFLRHTRALLSVDSLQD